MTDAGDDDSPPLLPELAPEGDKDDDDDDSADEVAIGGEIECATLPAPSPAAAADDDEAPRCGASAAVARPDFDTVAIIDGARASARSIGARVSPFAAASSSAVRSCAAEAVRV